jgi:hypothetical protein
MCGMKKGGSDIRTQLVAEWILARPKPLHMRTTWQKTRENREHDEASSDAANGVGGAAKVALQQ